MRMIVTVVRVEELLIVRVMHEVGDSDTYTEV